MHEALVALRDRGSSADDTRRWCVHLSADPQYSLTHVSLLFHARVCHLQPFNIARRASWHSQRSPDCDQFGVLFVEFRHSALTMLILHHAVGDDEGRAHQLGSGNHRLRFLHRCGRAARVSVGPHLAPHDIKTALTPLSRTSCSS